MDDATMKALSLNSLAKFRCGTKRMRSDFLPTPLPKTSYQGRSSKWL
jgi:hypothetical protein